MKSPCFVKSARYVRSALMSTMISRNTLIICQKEGGKREERDREEIEKKEIREEKKIYTHTHTHTHTHGTERERERERE